MMKNKLFFIFLVILLFSISIVTAAPDLRIVDAETSVQSDYPSIQLNEDYTIANVNHPVDFVVPVKNQGNTSTTGLKYSITCRAETDGFTQEDIPFLASEVLDPGEQVNIDFSCSFNPYDDLEGTDVRISYPGGIGDAHSFHIYTVNPDESVPIKEDYFFVLGGKYLLSYSGADSPSFQNPEARFRNEVSGDSLKFSVDSDGSGTISIDGNSYKFVAASATTDSDYDIQVDLNGDGTIKGVAVPEEPVYDGESVTHTLDEGDSREYDLAGFSDIKVLFVGPSTAKFQIGFEITDSLQKSETYYLDNGGRIKLLDISYDGSAGGIRRAKFKFTSPEDSSSTPDLKISEFTIEPNPEKDIAGESFKGKIVVKNEGNEITKCVKNCYNKGHELYNGRIPLVIRSSSSKIVLFNLPFETKIGEFFSIEPLKPGESKEINILINSFVSTEPGTYSVTVDAGALLEIGSYVINEQEDLLGDNRRTKEFKIGQDDEPVEDSSKPDLRIIDAETSVKSHYPSIQLSKNYVVANVNEPVNFVVPVKNQGDASTTGMTYSITCRAESNPSIQEDIATLSSKVIDPDEKLLIDFSCTFNLFDEIDEAELSISYPDGLGDAHNFKIYVVNPDESEPVAKDYYFVLGSKHLLIYEGADRPELSNAEARFRDVVTRTQIKVPVGSNGGSINIGGKSYKFVASGSTIDSDYNIQVDLNGDGKIEGAVVINECETDLDCNDDNGCTSDVCSGTPRKCSNGVTTIGCSLNNNCVPIGTRTETQFCDVDNSMKNQNLKDTSCNNNYECTSNVCINNKCIEPNFIQKIINWFIKLFGG
jgi:hypothetical protein